MIHKQHQGDDWKTCTLCRSHRQSQMVLGRAQQRKIDWPKPKEYSQGPIQDPVVFTSIDDAFSNILQYMSTTSRQCKRYFQSNARSHKSGCDQHHCDRFHSPGYSQVQRTNPLQSAEDVHLVLHPGTYAVTAGEWGTTRQQTHVVHVDPGQSVNLDFVM